MQKMVFSANSQESRSPDYLKYSNGAARKPQNTTSLTNKTPKLKVSSGTKKIIYPLLSKAEKKRTEELSSQSTN